MNRDDLRVLRHDPRWDDTLEPVTDADLADMGYLRADVFDGLEEVPGLEFVGGPAIETREWLAIPLDDIDMEALREAATLERADLIAHDWRKVETLQGFAQQILDYIDKEDTDAF